MSVLDHLASPSMAARRSGPNDRIVFSSRVRLARNVRWIPFPSHAKKADRVRAFDQLMRAVQSLPQMAPEPWAEPMEKLNALEKQILVERHLIRREHAARNTGSGRVLSRDESLCVIINEEDRLRMRALRPGLQL